MENKNIMIEEGVYIKTSPTVLDTDKISILQRRYANMEMGEIVFNLEYIRLLLTNNTNPQIIDDVLNSEFDDEMMARVTGWFDKLSEAMDEMENAKKKPNESSQTIKEKSEKVTS